MKTLYRISLFFNVMTLCAVAVFVGSMMAEKTNVKQKKLVNENEEIQVSEKSRLQLSDSKMENNLKTTAQNEEILTCDTIYFVSSYDIATGDERYKEEKIPAAYMGKNREQLLDLIEEYNLHPSLEDQEKGFMEMSLDTFSSKKVCVRKTYRSSFYFGCLVVEDGFLNVYDEKRKNVIIYTDILFDQLPEDMKQQILDGKYFKTEDELYNFLESYSS